MTSRTTRLCMCFVSGKGGVGKTMLAANVAWQCSKVADTLLVDADFQNQGCTGLMAPHFDLSLLDTFTAVKDPSMANSKEFVSLSAGLYFSPAVSWRTKPLVTHILKEVENPAFGARLRGFIERCTAIGFNIIVIDCHGGVDTVSFSAHNSSDVTFMVTEADSVTFSGTLELLSFYEERYSETDGSPRNHNVMPTGRAMPARASGVAEKIKNVKFVVNRVPSKYSFDHLEGLYKPYFAGDFGILSADRSVFCYIPQEELLAYSFGEYPFHVEVAPGSVYSKKINYLCSQILKGKFDDLTEAGLYAFGWYGERIRRNVLSQESRNLFSILNFFAWMAITVVLAMVILLVAGALSLFELGEAGQIALAVGSLGLVMASFVVTVYFFVVGLFGMMFYFRGRHLYQRRLFEALGERLTLWQRLALMRSFVLRWSTTIGIAVMGLFSVVFGAVIVG